MVAVAEVQGVGGGGDELMAVLFSWHGAEVGEAEPVEFRGRLVDGGVVGGGVSECLS